MDCQFQIPQVAGLKDNELTVGRLFTLQCPIELDPQTDIAGLKLLQPVEQNYKIHLLKVEPISQGQILLQMTSYQAGQHHLVNLSISDGVLEYPIPEQKIEVISVLPKDEQPQLHGPIGPQMIWPTAMSLIIGFAVFIYICLVLILKWLRYRQRNQLIEKLREHDSALTPIQQYYQLLRKEQRQSPIFFIDEKTVEENRRLLAVLEQGFRMFLTRHYLLPVNEWKDSLFLSELKKLDKKRYQLEHKELKNVLIEFEKANKDVDKLTKTDFLALVDHSRKLCEKLAEPKRKGE